MTEISSIILTGVFSGGLLTAIIGFVRYMNDRRKNKRNADAAGVTAPAKAESITVETMALAIKSLSQENVRINGRLEDADKERAADRADRESLHREISGLRKALQAAHHYIADWIAWGDRVAPGEPQPKPPPNYYRDY